MKRYLTKKDTQYLFELIKKLVAQFYSQKPSTRRRGRPVTYLEEVILFAVILKQHLNISYRTLESVIKDILGYSPDFSTPFYRFKRLDTKLVSFVLLKTSEICERVLKILKFCMV